jgi:cytochrome c-type biogenesis protein
MKAISKILIVSFVVLILITAGAAFLLLGQESDEIVIDKAPDFSLVDIDGNNITLGNFTDKIVVLDFMYIDCPSCIIAEKSMKEVYPKFEGEIQIISIDVVPSDTIADLKLHRNESNINLENWTIAKDSMQSEGGFVHQIYSVYEFVTIFIIDKDGYATYHKVGAMSSEEFERELNKAIQGTPPIEIPQLSIILVAIMAGIGSFFSPCAFPMLPGYMSYFLGLQTAQNQDAASRPYRKAVFGGVAGGIGIIAVYIIIGIIVVFLGSFSGYIPLLGPIIGIILIALGILMLTPFEYHRIIRPFQVLYAKLFRRKVGEGEKKEEDMTKGFYSKLFKYGVGYGAAASACVAPLFIVLVTGASAASNSGSVLDGLVILFLFAFIVIALMVGLTLALTVFGQKATQKLSKYTDVIKKTSAVVLIIVGVYLIIYYFLAFG